MAQAATRRRAAAAKPAPEPEVVEDEFEDVEDEDVEDGDIEESDEDDDLEEVGEDEEPNEAPKSKTRAKKATGTAPKKDTAPKRPVIEFGSAWLAAHITEVTGESFDGRGIRMLLRKLAKDGAFQRDVGVTRDRYNFSGAKDPVVLEVIKMVKSGAAKELKQAGLQGVKDRAAAKKAEAAKAKTAAPVEEDEMEEVEDEVEEAPKPVRRRAASTSAPAKATPAKAIPATTRRRAATTAK